MVEDILVVEDTVEMEDIMEVEDIKELVETDDIVDDIKEMKAEDTKCGVEGFKEMEIEGG